MNSEPSIEPNLTDAALVVLGHGSTVNDQSGKAVYAQAAELRRRRCFAEVREGFWKQEPLIAGVLQTLKEPRIFVLPLFISEGYFSEQVLAKALGFRAEEESAFSRVRHCDGQTFFYCKPIGTHPGITSVLLSRAAQVVKDAPFPRTPSPADISLFLAGHGTEQDQNSRQAVERQVELVRSMNLYAAVHPLFLEEEPRIEQCYNLAQTRNIIVVPFFISDGMHTQEDIPAKLGESRRIIRQRLEQGQPIWRNPTERNGKLVWYSASIGSDPRLADLVLERVKEAAAGEK